MLGAAYSESSRDDLSVYPSMIIVRQCPRQPRRVCVCLWLIGFRVLATSPISLLKQAAPIYTPSRHSVVLSLHVLLSLFPLWLTEREFNYSYQRWDRSRHAGRQDKARHYLNRVLMIFLAQGGTTSLPLIQLILGFYAAQCTDGERGLR